MKKTLLIVTLLVWIFSIVSCSSTLNSSLDNNESVNEQLRNEIIESYERQIVKMKEKIQILERENESLKKENDNLKKSQSDENLEFYIMSRFSALSRLVFEPFSYLKKIYLIAPEYDIKNDWFILNKDNIEIKLQGYDNVEHVSFYVLKMESEFYPVELPARKISDGWVYTSSNFSEEISDVIYNVYFVLYAEMESDGKIIRTPLLPFYFKM